MTLLTSDDRKAYLQYSQLALPRHTSYPAIPYWNKNLTSGELAENITHSNLDNLSLYFHIPFCQKLCFYCGCSKEVRPERDQMTQERVDRLLEGFKREIQLKTPVLKASKS